MTIKDIARESGYSVGTVSRVLNGAQGVSAAAKEAVMAVVDKYHFQLNNNAKLLKQQTSGGIAIIIKGTQNMLFATVVELIQALIEKRGYASMMFYIGEDDNEVEEAYKVCQERRPGGIMMKITEIREKTSAELATLLKEKKAELFNLRFQHAINQLDNPQKIVETKKTIAQILTIMTEKEQAEG